MPNEITFKEFFTIIKRAFLEDAIDNIELFDIGMCLVWAIWLFFHPTLFDNGQIYKTLGVLGSEYVWSAGFFFLAALKLYGISIDRYRTRKMIAFIVTMVWLFVMFTFIQDNSGALLVALTGYFAVVSAWEYFRHGRMVRLRERARSIVKSDLNNV